MRDERGEEYQVEAAVWATVAAMSRADLELEGQLLPISGWITFNTCRSANGGGGLCDELSRTVVASTK